MKVESKPDWLTPKPFRTYTFELTGQEQGVLEREAERQLQYSLDNKFWKSSKIWLRIWKKLRRVG